MTAKKKKLPYLKVYPGDEIQAAASGCSMAAQGLWFRLRLIMHSCEPYGFLCPGMVAKAVGDIHGTIAGQVSTTFEGQSQDKPGTFLDMVRNGPLDARVARMCSITVQEYLELRRELDDAGVTRYSVSGVMYCDELVQDAIDREYWSLSKRKQRDLPLGYQAEGAGHSRDKRGTIAGHASTKVDAVPALSSGYSYSYSNKEEASQNATKKRKPTEAERREQANAEVAESIAGRGRS